MQSASGRATHRGAGRPIDEGVAGVSQKVGQMSISANGGTGNGGNGTGGSNGMSLLSLTL